MKNTPSLLAILGLIFCTSGATADDVYQETTLSLDYAQRLAGATVAACRKDGYKVSVAVLDKKGIIKALLTDDGAFLHSGDASLRKAYASISRQLPSHAIQEHINKNNDINTALNFTSLGMSTWGGGLPIKYKEEVVGAIGVSGAPGSELDVACATAALAEISITTEEKS
ncbi:MAG: heme-binding protein [Pseudomonadales bacterium]